MPLLLPPDSVSIHSVARRCVLILFSFRIPFFPLFFLAFIFTFYFIFFFFFLAIIPFPLVLPPLYFLLNHNFAPRFLCTILSYRFSSSFCLAATAFLFAWSFPYFVCWAFFKKYQLQQVHSLFKRHHRFHWYLLISF